MRLCSIEGCGKKHFGRNFCISHFCKNKRYGNPLGKPIERPVKASGGKRIIGHGEGRYLKKTPNTNKGYWVLLCPCHPNADSKGYVFEHRLVMEVSLNRFLIKGECVHHKDGNSTNNSLDNLEVVTLANHSQRHKYWLLSPTMGKGSKPKYPNMKCKKPECNKPAKVNEYCSNHNRDIWRNKRRALSLAYT